MLCLQLVGALLRRLPCSEKPSVGPQSNASEQAEVEKSKLVFIMGAIGFGLDIISILFLYGNFSL